jgi:N-acetyl-gamma-glutamyl-phosphate reductase
LLRLLGGHPNVEIDVVTSRSHAGLSIADVFPSLRGHIDLAFSMPDPGALRHCDLAFFATPTGMAMRMVPALIEFGARVIDLSADFRLKDASEWQRWYGEEHQCPDLLGEAVYGLPEVNREAIRDAKLVANPGCYPTAIQLGFLPLVEAGAVELDGLIADAKSGVSGAGRKESLATQLAEAGDNFKAYSASGHRHLPEVLQGLKRAANGRGEIRLTFVPHLTPMIRGIHATLYARLTRQEVDVQQLFERRYATEPFVDVLPAGSHPDTRGVRGTNVCRLSSHRPGGGDTIVVLVVEDNLVKGAAGQAIQNMNIMLGFDEGLGLRQVACVP